ncbi:MAG: Cas10/Cmr2 second palm domain-containing protein [Thermodesulfovibrionales bacterium]
MEYLLSLDIGGIHEYIFGTNKLREIRGASILLDKLNREFPLKKLNGYGMEGSDWKHVMTAGGNIKILFNDKTKAEDYKNYLINLFRDKAPGAKVTVIISARNGLNEEQWLKKADRELRWAKALHKERVQILTSSFFKSCQACGLYPTEEKDIRSEESEEKEIRYICKTCYQKIEQSKTYQDIQVYKELANHRGSLNLPDEFGDIGGASKPEGYMGFIYADGNKMGEHIAKIKSFDELTRFSSDVHNATLKATVSAIDKHFPGDILPLQIILAGGDDLILALPAHKTIDVAIDFCESFNKNLKSHGITTCVGIVICHDSLPIKTVLNTAESLLKNAKAESRKKDNSTYIDFTVVTGSAIEDPILKRKREMEIKDTGIHYITKRPYHLEELKILRDIIMNLKRIDFPKNKLKLLYASLFKGHHRSIFEACYIKTRLKQEHRELINSFQLTRFPWEEVKPNEYKTPLGDITELYEFINIEDMVHGKTANESQNSQS